jgi:hypothetical protein
MTINTKFRLTILASALALAATAPAAFADSGVWYRSMHTQSAGTSVAPAAVRGGQSVNNKLASAGVASNTGTWHKNIFSDSYTDSADHPAAGPTKQVMDNKFASAGVAPNTGTWHKNIFSDAFTDSADHSGASYSRQAMEKQVVPSKLAGNEVEKSVELTDGSTVQIFADGKMAMESKFGRATTMESGHVMDTKDGKNLNMNGNEAARLDQLLNKDVSGG